MGEEAVLGAGKRLNTFVPLVGLASAFPIDDFSTSRRFEKGAETVRPEDLIREFPFGSSLVLRTVCLDRSPALTCIPVLGEGREMGKTISGTGLTNMGARADVGSRAIFGGLILSPGVTG